MELLGVIVVLSIIALITVPIVMGSLNSAKEELSKEQIRSIESAARMWGTKNLYVDGNNPSQSFVTIQSLIDDGQLESKDFDNINLKKSSFSSAGVCIKYLDNQFVYTYKINQSEC